jgi:hypothetical protein
MLFAFQMNHLYNMFVKQVEDYCGSLSMPGEFLKRRPTVLLLTSTCVVCTSSQNAQKLPMLSECFGFHADGCYMFGWMGDSHKCVLFDSAVSC